MKLRDRKWQKALRRRVRSEVKASPVLRKKWKQERQSFLRRTHEIPMGFWRTLIMIGWMAAAFLALGTDVPVVDLERSGASSSPGGSPVVLAMVIKSCCPSGD